MKKKQVFNSILNKYSLTQDSQKGDLNWDSITHLSLLTELSELFETELTLEIVNEIKTIDDVIKRFNIDEE